jgi:Flp pilus assembly CpaE family ATPase
LQFLFAQPNQNGRFAQPNSDQVNAVLDTLTKASQTVVADLSYTMSAAQRGVLERADRIVVVVSPERVALASAKRLLRYLPEVMAPYAMVSAVIFDIDSRMNLPQKAVETYLEHPLQTIIPVALDELTQTANKGAMLVGAYPDGKTARRFYKLAKHLIPKK